jgi:hypothetical protein
MRHFAPHQHLDRAEQEGLGRRRGCPWSKEGDSGAPATTLGATPQLAGMVIGSDTDAQGGVVVNLADFIDKFLLVAAFKLDMTHCEAP